MSRLSAAFFSWLHDAPFYRALHDQAVALTPPGEGRRRWLDVGCGPGLVAELAAQRGYLARGVDRDPAMAARAARRHPQLCFSVGDLASVASGPAAEVVSAASLLFVLPDPRQGLAQLWAAVAPGGLLMTIDTSAAMTPAGVRAAIAAGVVPPGRRVGLRLWAATRQGRAPSPALFDAPPDAVARRREPLLGGLAEAWLWEKAAV